MKSGNALLTLKMWLAYQNLRIGAMSQNQKENLVILFLAVAAAIASISFIVGQTLTMGKG